MRIIGQAAGVCEDASNLPNAARRHHALSDLLMAYPLKLCDLGVSIEHDVLFDGLLVVAVR